ncbi:hypothetical protein [Rodentibacter genomosp. 2]|uniref:hypothetical protein n=1 Tax=Rodentibacter genomosp. 2 TaxID=1908266 RepID=UPI0015C2E095|nr:hypothetical protein [Rodentibacter genomosp. 2]
MRFFNENHKTRLVASYFSKEYNCCVLLQQLWELYMEAVATLLNTLVSRILFSHFTMFLVFLFVGFYFMPPELAADLNSKTPAFFPDWFTLANFGSFVFACVATILWILLLSGIKQGWQCIHHRILIGEHRKTIAVMKKRILNANESEKIIINKIWQNNCSPTELCLANSSSLNALELDSYFQRF